MADQDVMFEDPQCINRFLQRLYKLKEIDKFTDISVTVKNKQFLLHRNVLFASCPYFYTLFQIEECSAICLRMPGMTPTGFSAMIEFMYTGRIRTTKEKLTDIFEAAKHLEMVSVGKWCQSLLKDKNESRALSGATLTGTTLTGTTLTGATHRDHNKVETKTKLLHAVKQTGRFPESELKGAVKRGSGDGIVVPLIPLRRAMSDVAPDTHGLQPVTYTPPVPAPRRMPRNSVDGSDIHLRSIQTSSTPMSHSENDGSCMKRNPMQKAPITVKELENDSSKIQLSPMQKLSTTMPRSANNTHQLQPATCRPPVPVPRRMLRNSLDSSDIHLHSMQTSPLPMYHSENDGLMQKSLTRMSQLENAGPALPPRPVKNRTSLPHPNMQFYNENILTKRCKDKISSTCLDSDDLNDKPDNIYEYDVVGQNNFDGSDPKRVLLPGISATSEAKEKIPVSVDKSYTILKTVEDTFQMNTASNSVNAEEGIEYEDITLTGTDYLDLISHTSNSSRSTNIPGRNTLEYEILNLPHAPGSPANRDISRESVSDIDSLQPYSSCGKHVIYVPLK